MKSNKVRLDIGDRVGRLTIIGPIVTRDGKRSYSLARCDCGKEWMAGRTGIRAGRIMSCGCAGREKRKLACTTHGQSPRGPRSRAYDSWASMIQRCTNPNSAAYEHYGARGITVCDEWKSFDAFFRDMGERPRGKELDRIDNEKGYVPGNCHWATRHAQMRNTRKTKMVVLGGVEMCATDAAAKLGVPAGRIFWHVHKHGITHQEALNRLLGH